MAKSTVELAEQATGRGSPGSALAAITELRKRLAELEQSRVAAALRAGMSWSAIAEQLGISKQAAHRKHSAAVAALEAGREQAPRLVLGGEARAAVRLGMAEAGRRGDPHVGPAHILIGALDTGAAVAAPELEQAGLTADRCRAALNGLYGADRHGLLGSGSDSDDPASGGPVAISYRGREALEGSLREAVRLRSQRLGVDHLLLALLRTSQGSCAEMLHELGVARGQLCVAIERAVSEERA